MQINIPTTLSSKGIDLFKELYRQKTGITLSTAEARIIGLELVVFFASLLEAEFQRDYEEITRID